MTRQAHTPSRAMLALLAVLWLLATVRALLPVLHEPLYAYANSYDQARYTGCFHLFPDRPASVPPDRNSPEAPYASFRFMEDASPLCYGSSELLFTGAAALAWHVSEAVGGPPVHDVRPLGVLRWSALLALSAALSCAWLRRGRPLAALANAALLPLLFSDPANTLYLATFYAEWSALLWAYALLAALLLWREASPSRARVLLLALAALLLATSKIQHLLLPLAVAAGLALAAWRSGGRPGWRVAAVAVGSIAGLGLQLVQLQRSDPMMQAIDQYNRADVLFTALLPHADDPRGLLRELGIDEACAAYVGLHAWELPDLPEPLCAGFDRFGRGDQLRVLFGHPRLALRLAAAAPGALVPWIAANLGQVEGGTFDTMPADAPPMVGAIGRLLQQRPWLQRALLVLPPLALLVLLALPRRRAGSGVALEASATTSALMLATLGVTVLGDGLADVPKQGHLVTNAALAWLIVVSSIAVAAAWRGGWPRRT
jgi:hypothetical protein